MSKLDRSVPWIQQYGPKISLYAAAGLTIPGEAHLAIIAKYPWFLCLLFPLALDIYAAVSMSVGKRVDIAISVLLMICAQVVYHLVEAGLIPPEGVSGIVITAVTVVIPPIILWRIHSITHKAAAKPKTVVKEVIKEVPVEVIKEVPVEVIKEVPMPARKPRKNDRRATAGRGNKHETMQKISAWFAANEGGSIAECARQLGMSAKWVGIVRGELLAAGAAA